MKSEQYFILSSNCRLVKGFTRGVVIDYARADLFFVTHQYLQLLQTLDRRRIRDIEEDLEDLESKEFFEEFLEVISRFEIGFFTENPENFPKISEEPDDGHIPLMDVIIEIDESVFDRALFRTLCNDLSDLHCKDFQIRLLSDLNLTLLQEVIEVINTTNANYIEIHCSYSLTLSLSILHQFIDKNPLVSQFFIYSAPESREVEVVNPKKDHFPISLGMIYFIDYSFDNGNCCGIINQETLNYTSFYVHNKLKTRNGCLDRKISIDRFGNIKNCPSMKVNYGNIRAVSIKDVLVNKLFQKYWFINKDQISICKFCEFRYNCTDCRAFTQDPDDIYSKPLKCGYDPFTGIWKEADVPIMGRQDIAI